MINVEKLKYLSRDFNTLMDSNSVKITFNSSLLSKYIYIWKVNLRVYSYVNRIRKCVKYCHYSSNNCRGRETLAPDGDNHFLNKAEWERCANCRKDQAFYLGCPVFAYLKLVNTVCVYTNVDRQLAQRLIRQQNIRRVKNVYNFLAIFVYRSLAYSVREIREETLIFFRPLNLGGGSISEILDNPD